jgi:enterochelin esterase family protein
MDVPRTRLPRGLAVPAALLLVSLVGRAQPPPLSEWLAHVERLPAADRARAIETRIAEAGGTPLVDGTEVVFLVRSTAARAPRIVGDFNAWGNEGDDFNPAAGTMRRIESTPWFALHVTLRLDARVEYLVDLGGRQPVADSRNPRRVVSFNAPTSEVAMPGHVVPPEVTEALGQGNPARRVDALSVDSQVFGARRRAYVYLPRVPRRDDQRWPVVYFGDGSGWVVQGLAPLILDRLIARSVVRPVVAVFVEPGNRSEEYNRSAAYRRFFVNELMPYVEARYPIDRRRTSRAVIGSSRGALAAFDLAFEHSDLIGHAGLLSIATRPHDVAGLVRASPPRPVAFFFVTALYDRRWLPDARRLDEALRSKGYQVTSLEIAQGHSYLAWREHLGDVLRAFFPG